MQLVEEAVDGCWIGHRARTASMEDSGIGSVYSPPKEEHGSPLVTTRRKHVETVVDIGYRPEVGFIFPVSLKKCSFSCFCRVGRWNVRRVEFVVCWWTFLETAWSSLLWVLMLNSTRMVWDWWHGLGWLCTCPIASASTLREWPSR